VPFVALALFVVNGSLRKKMADYKEKF